MFTCPRCGMTSHNVNDAREGYCGNCHDYTGDTKAREQHPDA
jgi:ribosomal protein S27AE